jgi:hypothetical protein
MFGTVLPIEPNTMHKVLLPNDYREGGSNQSSRCDLQVNFAEYEGPLQIESRTKAFHIYSNVYFLATATSEIDEEFSNETGVIFASSDGLFTYEPFNNVRYTLSCVPFTRH